MNLNIFLPLCAISLASCAAVFTDASKNLTSTGTLGADQGGTGKATLTANNVLLGNGTSALQTVAPSTSGNVLTSNGTTWQSKSFASSGIKLGLGITGETWHDVTGSRNAGQTYSNSYSYPIYIAAGGSAAAV